MQDITRSKQAHEAMDNTVLQAMDRFSKEYGRDLTVQSTRWRYYALGQGPAVLWLTGGLRRAVFGFAFLERLARTHRVIAPDYPPLMTFRSMAEGFDAILRAEGIARFDLGGQSYGGLLAQGYLALQPDLVDRLVLSSTGPADYGRLWLLADYIGIGVVRLLPERQVKKMLAGSLGKILSVPEAERQAWEAALEHILTTELTRQDVVSHFAVVADMIRSRLVVPRALDAWQGRVIVLTAADDPTQSPADIPRYEALFGRRIDVLSMGSMGHTAALLDPDSYVEMLERALA
jgi:pimeloyl-ACP methyl ester carboxylesterase